MKNEVELRFRIADNSKIKIPKHREPIEQSDIYYKGWFPGVLRLRVSGDMAEIAYKCMNNDGTWRELETDCSDPATFRRLAEAIGLRELIQISKKRCSWREGDIEINFDEVKDLGNFCELEIMDGTREQLMEKAKELGLGEPIEIGYVQMMMSGEDREMEHFEDVVNEQMAELKEIMLKKHHDYGSQNLLNYRDKGVLVRADDKLCRLKSLVWEGKSPENEKVNDTWIDLAGYSILALLLRNKKLEHKS